jgi:phenylpropionate dioxygenase-like ring-hydroxylating dioxygenase large terminal subunit
VELLGTPFVLFRGEGGKPAALLDRCPHRNAPLSLGRVVPGGRLECRYHGWQFEGTGRCALVPGLTGGTEARERRAPAAATREAHGLIWIWPELDEEPTSELYPLAPLAPGYARVVRRVEAPGTLHATLENALDVPHTAFLHGGLFRTAERKNEIEVRIHRGADGAEAEFIGEPRPSGLVGRVLSPGGGVVEHFDRFIMPCIAQVEYRLGEGSHLLNTAAMTPITANETRVWAVIQLRLPIPSRLIAPVITPIAMRILRQDASILRLQAKAIQRFGGEDFTSTEIDVLGPHIWKLLAAASNGDAPAPFDHRVTMRV